MRSPRAGMHGTVRHRVGAVLAIVLLAVVGPGWRSAPVSAAPPIPPPSADPFYRYDGLLGAYAPGAVLRTRSVPFGYRGATAPIRSSQVLYRTTDQQGRPTSTVATILQPPVAGPPKLLSYHMAYDALGPQCDPSYTLTGAGSPGAAGTLEQGVISGYLSQGYTVVVPDYEGPDLQWTIGREAGYAALDGVRATQKILRLPTTTPVAMAGYSGGSVPTQWGAEVAPSYAPEIRLIAAAAGGLPVNLAHNLPYVSGSKDWVGVIPALIVAYRRVYSLDTDAFLSARGKKIVKTVSSQCINAFAAKYPGLTDADMVRPPYHSLLDVPGVVRAINDNIMGTSGTPRIPMLLGVGDVDGTGDGVMITRDVESLAYSYCRRGVRVSYAQFTGKAHGEAFIPFQEQTARFLTDRFARRPTASNCATLRPGDGLSPTSVP